MNKKDKHKKNEEKMDDYMNDTMGMFDEDNMYPGMNMNPYHMGMCPYMNYPMMEEDVMGYGSNVSPMMMDNMYNPDMVMGEMNIDPMMMNNMHNPHMVMGEMDNMHPSMVMGEYIEDENYRNYMIYMYKHKACLYKAEAYRLKALEYMEKK